MEIIKVSPRGFCKGVVNAIEIAKRTRKQHPSVPITILGMLVHNQKIVDALTTYNIQTLDIPNKTRSELLDYIDEGYVIFTAHGVSDAVIQKAQNKGLKVVDATCEYVSLIHRLVKQKLEEGYEIGYIGKKGHPESEAVLELSSHIHLIETLDDLTFSSPKMFFTNQTTLSFREICFIYEEIKKKFPHAVINNEICNATQCRQEAILNLESVDALIVVGDPKSHNTQKLASLGKSKAKKVYLIDDIQKCFEIDLNVEKIAITSGASTPTKLTNQIIHYLETKEIISLDIKDWI